MPAQYVNKTIISCDCEGCQNSTDIVGVKPDDVEVDIPGWFRISWKLPGAPSAYLKRFCSWRCMLTWLVNHPESKNQGLDI